jgi:two-component system, OmpR family, response regulator MprA
MRDTILIVEDDPEMAEVLGQGFEQDRINVRVAQDGAEGLSCARQGQFQAIILDVMLPVMDGYTLARELRSSGDRTPILMLTARDSITDIVHGLDSGVDDYLTKPFSFLELSARVRALIRRAAPPATRLEVGDLVLDLTRLEAYRGTRSLRLTRTEFQLLEILVLHQGHVVRRRDLLRQVWGTTANVEENTLDVAISSLRRRIEAPGLPRLLHTVRGFGYRMEAQE